MSQHKIQPERAGQLSRAQRKVYDLAWSRLIEPDAPAQLTWAREYIAQECKVSSSTVVRAVASIRRLGLLDIQTRSSGIVTLQLGKGQS